MCNVVSPKTRIFSLTKTCTKMRMFSFQAAGRWKYVKILVTVKLFICERKCFIFSASVFQIFFRSRNSLNFAHFLYLHKNSAKITELFAKPTFRFAHFCFNRFWTLFREGEKEREKERERERNLWKVDTRKELQKEKEILELEVILWPNLPVELGLRTSLIADPAFYRLNADPYCITNLYHQTISASH